MKTDIDSQKGRGGRLVEEVEVSYEDSFQYFLFCRFLVLLLFQKRCV